MTLSTHTETVKFAERSEPPEPGETPELIPSAQGIGIDGRMALQSKTELQRRLKHRAADAGWRHANREARRAAQRIPEYLAKVKARRIALALREAGEVQS